MAYAVALYEQVDNRNENLVLAHMPMVKRIAVHLKARIPPFMEVDELVQVGMVGLIEAARAFDPTRGIEFEAFALARVRGAMLDEVRRLSFLPRSAVAFNQSEGQALHVLVAELGRQPTQAELADYLGKDIEAFHKERMAAHRFEHFSMEVVSEEVLSMADERERQPDAIVEQQEFMQVLQETIEALPERERLVMQLYYAEELNLKEIGEVLGVSESRVSQILSATAKKLRQQLKL